MDAYAVFPRALYYETSNQDFFILKARGTFASNFYIGFVVFTEITMENAVFGMWRRVDLL
jgi:hypothetical protein